MFFMGKGVCETLGLYGPMASTPYCSVVSKVAFNCTYFSNLFSIYPIEVLGKMNTYHIWNLSVFLYLPVIILTWKFLIFLPLPPKILLNYQNSVYDPFRWAFHSLLCASLHGLHPTCDSCALSTLCTLSSLLRHAFHSLPDCKHSGWKSHMGSLFAFLPMWNTNHSCTWSLSFI